MFMCNEGDTHAAMIDHMLYIRIMNQVAGLSFVFIGLYFIRYPTFNYYFLYPPLPSIDHWLFPSFASNSRRWCS